MNTEIHKSEPSVEYWGLSIHCPHRSSNNLLGDTAPIDLLLVLCSLPMSPLLARDISVRFLLMSPLLVRDIKQIRVYPGLKLRCGLLCLPCATL